MKSTIILPILILLGLTLGSGQDSVKVDLESLISRIKSDNFDVRKSELDLKISKAEYDESKSWYLPKAFLGTTLHDLNGSAMNGDGKIFMEVDRQNRWYGAGLDFQWNLGEGIFIPKARKYAYQSMEHTTTDQKNQITYRAIRVYYNVLRLSKIKSHLESGISSKLEVSNQIESQVNAGLRPDSELFLILSSINRDKLKQLSLSEELEFNKSELSILLNLEQDEVLSLNSKELTEIQKLDFESDNETGSHPLISAQKLDIDSKKQISSAINKGLWLPSIGIRYNIGQFGDRYDDTQSTNNYEAYIGWQIPLGQLIYNGEGKKVTAQLDKSILEKEKNEAHLQHVIKQYRMLCANSKAVLEEIEGGSSYAARAVEIAELRIEQGIGNSYELLKAQEEFIESEEIYYTQLMNYRICQVQLWLALGNSF